jgi:hypothetical protein
MKRGKKKALGARTAGLDMSAEYEAWVENLREAINQEDHQDSRKEQNTARDEDADVEKGD